MRGLKVGILFLVLALASALSMGSEGPVSDLSSLKGDYLEFLSTHGGVDHSQLENYDRDFLSKVVKDLTKAGSIKVENDVLSTRFMNRDSSPSLRKSISVCIVVSSLEGLYVNSGIGTAYATMAELLAQQGQKVTILYTNKEGPAQNDWSYWEQVYQAKGITLARLPSSDVDLSISDLAAQSYSVYEYLSTNSFEIVHFPEWEGIGYYTLVAKHQGLGFAKTKFVVGLHGSTRWAFSAQNKIPVTQVELEADFMEQKSIELADFVWSPSQAIGKWVAEQGWKLPSESYLMPFLPGSDLQALMDARKNVESTKVDQVSEFVFFGRLEYRKGLELFCDAIDKLADTVAVDDLTITFLGRSVPIDDEDSISYIQRRAAIWPFTLKMLTTYDRTSALEYLMKDGRVAVIPSIIDNSPFTVYETLMLRIPFISTNIDSIREMVAVSDRASHLVEPNAEALSENMITALQNGLTAPAATFGPNTAPFSWLSLYSYISNWYQTNPVASTATPKVSVCITHYNREKLLKLTLDSVRAQDYKNYEIVLVDDGSSDPNSLNYLNSIEAEFKSRNWKLIYSENNYLGAARNLAVQHASGEYIYFIDDDNLMRPNTLSTFVRVALRTSVDLISAGHDVFTGMEKAGEQNIQSRWIPLGASAAVGLYRNVFGDASFFVKRASFLNIGGFSEERGIGLEDHEFLAKWVLSGNTIEPIPQALSFYRVHDENDQMTYTTDPIMNQLRYLRSYSGAFESNPESVFRFMSLKDTVMSICNETTTVVTSKIGGYGGRITFSGSQLTCANPIAVTVGSLSCVIDRATLSDAGFVCVVATATLQNKGSLPVKVTYQSGGNFDGSIEITDPTVVNYVSASFISVIGIQVKFDLDTNKANGGSLCSSFFDTATVNKLSATSICTFSDAKTIFILLGSSATIAAGDSITLKSGAIRPDGENLGIAVSGSKVLASAASLGPIELTLSVPTTVSTCDTVLIQVAAFSAGRAFTKSVWTLINLDTTETVDVTPFRSESGTNVEFPSGELEAGKYRVTVNYANWVGSEDTISKSFTITELLIPTVTVAPVGMSVLRSDSITLTSNAKASACSPGSTISYLWSVTPLFDLTGVVLTAPTLLIPANRVTAGQTYTFTVTVVTNSNSASNQASSTVGVGFQGMDLTVASNYITAGVGEDAILDASFSDRDEPDVNPTAVWECVVSDSASWTTSCDGVTLLNANTKTATFSNVQIGKYLFKVTITKAGKTDVSTTVQVLVVAGKPLKFGVSMNADGVLSTANDFARSDRITFSPVANEGEDRLPTVTSWKWTVAPAVVGLSLRNRELFIPANSLTAFTSYTFTVTATLSGTASTASVIRFCYSGPINGGLTVRIGTPASTWVNRLYFVDVSNWVIPGGNGLIQYELLVDDVTVQAVSPATSLGPVILSPGIRKIGLNVIYKSASTAFSATYNALGNDEGSSVSADDALGIKNADGSPNLNAVASVAGSVIGSITDPNEQAAAKEAALALASSTEALNLLAYSPSGGTVALEILSVAVGGTGGEPGSLPPTAENVAATVSLMLLAVEKLSSNPAALLKNPSVLNKIFNVIGGMNSLISNTNSASAKRGLSFMAQRAVSSSGAAVINAVKSLATNLLQALSVTEDPIKYADNVYNLIIKKASLESLPGQYRLGSASAFLPSALSEKLSTSGDFGAGIGTLLVSWANNVYDVDPDFDISASVFTIEFTSNGQDIKLYNLSFPLYITLEVEKPITAPNQAQCVYYDTINNKWSDYGCVQIIETDTIVTCACNHTTDYSAASTFVDCEGVYKGSAVVDACGKCGGTNSSCCSNYLGVENNLWDFVLLPVAVDDMIQRLEKTRSVIEWTYDAVPEIEDMSIFYQWGDVAELNKLFLSDCLSPFCKKSTNFLENLNTALAGSVQETNLINKYAFYSTLDTIDPPLKRV